MSEDFDFSCQIKDLGAFHINSFNFIVHRGLDKICLDIDPVYTTNHMKISVSEAVMKRLYYPMDTKTHRKIVYPSEARLRAVTYYAQLDVQLRFETKNEFEFCTREFYVPVMLKSDLCFLRGLDRNALIKVKEDFNDPGGYCIVNGSERLFRNFIVLKRNYPLIVAKRKWKLLRGHTYSEYGVLIRSVKDEHIFSTTSIHLLRDGGFEIRLFYNFTFHYIPLMLILKALIDKSDALIVKEILKYHRDFPTLRLKNMLQGLHERGIHSHDDAKLFLGDNFYRIFNCSREDASAFLFKKSLLVHLDKFEDKFQFLCFSLCKLHCASMNHCRLDDLDNPIYHEILSSGQIYMLMIKEGIISYLKSVRNVIQRNENKAFFHFHKDAFKKYCNKAISFTPQVASMIATGNFPGRKYGLRSETGWTICLKRTNMLQLASQFTAICKFPVLYFLLQTRFYYPESWGFLCPTQTPEGEKSGIHNYLASQCKVVNLSSDKIKEEVLFDFGVIPYNDPLVYLSRQLYPVLVDGKIIGWINYALTGKFLYKLRELKSSSNNAVPFHTEIVFISRNQHLFPGIYLFSTPCRMLRKALVNEKEEYIGVFEQVFLCDTLSIIPYPVKPSCSEIDAANILGLSTRMIPYCEHNSTVRNIYSSEKCKQALGLPFLNFNGRADSKTYQLLHCQSPIVSSKLYWESNFDLYPHGTNVVVAVMSYSGFDMEDAIVLNKASIERGLMNNILYKTIYFDFEELASECGYKGSTEFEFKRNDKDPYISEFLDEDGFPYIGTRVRYDDPILSVFYRKDGFLIKRYPERCDSFVHSVRIMGTSTANVPKANQKLSITFCIRQVPGAGDKFYTRHGGKGICSALMRPEDLPFTESGLVPDVLFNPHGLPSRMPIGMLFEMAAAKAKVSIKKMLKVKCTVEPFESKHDKVYDSIGVALAEAGFDYYGTEKFYCGTSGIELEADVFCGIMYHMRLHHMVEAKYQVQSVGPVDQKTLQPINLGRSGAIRFGEMERDAILSHGAAHLTLDRLLLNSDKSSAFVCKKCKMLICPILPHAVPELRIIEDKKLEKNLTSADCQLCKIKTKFKIQIPHVLYYLICELAVLGISVKFSKE